MNLSVPTDPNRQFRYQQAIVLKILSRVCLPFVELFSATRNDAETTPYYQSTKHFDRLGARLISVL